MEQCDILLVEDTSTQAIIMQQMLVAAGHSVVIKKSAEDALFFLETATPQILLTDINLPEMDGYEMTRIIKANDKLKNIPVVLLVAFKDKQEFFEIVNSGADNFMLKLLKRDYFVPTFNNIAQSLSASSANNATFKTTVNIGNTEQALEFCPQKSINMLSTCFDIITSQLRQMADK